MSLLLPHKHFPLPSSIKLGKMCLFSFNLIGYLPLFDPAEFTIGSSEREIFVRIVRIEMSTEIKRLMILREEVKSVWSVFNLFCLRNNEIVSGLHCRVIVNSLQNGFKF